MAGRGGGRASRAGESCSAPPPTVLTRITHIDVGEKGCAQRCRRCDLLPDCEGAPFLLVGCFPVKCSCFLHVLYRGVVVFYGSGGGCLDRQVYGLVAVVGRGKHLLQNGANRPNPQAGAGARPQVQAWARALAVCIMHNFLTAAFHSNLGFRVAIADKEGSFIEVEGERRWRMHRAGRS